MDYYLSRKVLAFLLSNFLCLLLLLKLNEIVIENIINVIIIVKFT